MKVLKRTILYACCITACGLALAGEPGGESGEGRTEGEDRGSTDESSSKSNRVGKEALAGWYFGIGGGWSCQENKVDFLDATCYSQTAPTPEERRGDEALGWVYRADGKTADLNLHGAGKKSGPGRLEGTIALGCGRCWENSLYVGIEGCVNLADRNSKVIESPEIAGFASKAMANLKTNLLTPGLHIRIGYWLDCARTLIYAKLGAEYLRAETRGEGRWEGSKIKVERVTPSFGLGIQHPLGKKLSIAIECAYSLPIRKDGTLVDKSFQIATTRLETKCKIRAERISGRALLIYNLSR